MFGLGFTELLVLAVVALLVVGPEKLPELMRTLAKATHTARSTLDELKMEIDDVKRTADLEIKEIQLSDTCEQECGCEDPKENGTKDQIGEEQKKDES